MADLLYDHGLDEWRNWETADFQWIALDSSHTPDRTHQFVADVAADEIAVTGYSRTPVDTPTRTVDTTLHRVTYDCVDPNLGNLAAGATVGYVVLARIETDDEDSPLIALFDLPDFETDGAPLRPVIAGTGVHYIEQV